MKKILDPKWLPVVTLGAGAVGFLLRLWMMTGGKDEKGLLVTSHPATVLIFLLTALFLGALYLLVRPVTGTLGYSKLFPAHPVSAAGCVVAAVGVVVAAVRSTQQGVLYIILLVTGILAALSLLVLAVLRFMGRRPTYLLRSMVTVFFTVQLICQYRGWIRETQFAVYFFPLLASIFLMLAAFHGAELDAKKTDRRKFLLCNQAAAFFCAISVYGGDWIFYLTMVIWLATGICSVKSAKKAEPEA